MILDKDIRDIQAYQNGLLPEFRRVKFEERLQYDLEFRTKYEELAPLLDGLNSLREEDNIKKSIVEVFEEQDPLVEENSESQLLEKPLKKIPKKYLFIYWAIAASLCIFIGVRWHDNIAMNDLYDEYYAFNTNTSRGSTNESCVTKSQLELLSKKQFQTLLDVLSASSNSNECIDYYKGICYLGLHKSSLAITSFKNTTNSVDIELKDNAEWYIALAYLQNHDKKKAKEQLLYILSVPDHQYELLAQELLGKIERQMIY